MAGAFPGLPCLALLREYFKGKARQRQRGTGDTEPSDRDTTSPRRTGWRSDQNLAATMGRWYEWAETVTAGPRRNSGVRSRGLDVSGGDRWNPSLWRLRKRLFLNLALL